MMLPVVDGEGPFGTLLCPSRELARQTFEVVEYFCQVSGLCTNRNVLTCTHHRSLPLIMLVLEEETELPVVGGEGPFSIILCPSRELTRQIFEVVEYFCQVNKRRTGRNLLMCAITVAYP